MQSPRGNCVGANAGLQLDARLIRFEGTSVRDVSVSSHLCLEPSGPHPFLMWKPGTHSWLESTWARAGLWPASFGLQMSAITFPYIPNALLLSSSCWMQALELSVGFFKQICCRDSHHLSQSSIAFNPKISSGLNPLYLKGVLCRGLGV